MQTFIQHNSEQLCSGPNHLKSNEPTENCDSNNNNNLEETTIKNIDANNIELHNRGPRRATLSRNLSMPSYFRSQDVGRGQLGRHHRHRHLMYGSARGDSLGSGARRRNLDAKPVSPASSSVSTSSSRSSTATDSAYGQSQTTIESESSDTCKSSKSDVVINSSRLKQMTECKSFTSPSTMKSFHHNDQLNGQDHTIIRQSNLSQPTGNSRDKIIFYSSSSDKTTQGDSQSTCTTNMQSPEQEDFAIIWRNLTLRVPKKRFARLRNAIWQEKSGQVVELESGLNNTSCSPRVSIDGSDLVAPIARPNNKPREYIFEGLNGCIKSSQLTAILGPSGAGKTSLLKCLTSSISRGLSGSIRISGGDMSRRLKICIIPQKDYLFDNLTVMENLLFASRIKNTRKNTAANFDHLQNVEGVCRMLGIESCLNVKTSKLSGGQYKRVSIAQELLSQPDILILDEPTSGLDSLTCFRTVSVLNDLVQLSRAGLMSPLAIIMTIHQPQIKVFNLFHHVYIMSSLGRCVYEGRPDRLLTTVADCCKLLPPADDLNPASFIIDLGSEVYGSQPVEQLCKLQRENFDILHQLMVVSSSSSSLSSSACSSSSFNVLSGSGNSSDEDDVEDIECPSLTHNHRNHHHHHHIYLDRSPTSHLITQKENPTKDTLDDEKKHNIISTSLAKPEAPPNHVKGAKHEKLHISRRLRRYNDHRGSFWLHTSLLIKRLWLSMWRDPLLATTRIIFHLTIPFVFYFIYSQKSGQANACPVVEKEIDLRTMTSDANLMQMQSQHNELILTFENVSLFFLLLYSFSMCVLAVTALSFPLNMQILLKETSNGWYSMARFVMAKTLADLPMELLMPSASVSIAYYLTGQPSSYLSWRMLTITAVMTLCSLISQTQGLLFGAYFMNNVQAAVFVSQASSLPWIMLSGFTTRISELPTFLQYLSFGSIYRLGIESIVSVRYGFGTCPCDENTVNDKPARLVGIPESLRSIMSYYSDVYNAGDALTNSTTAVANTTTTTSMASSAMNSTLDDSSLSDAGNSTTSDLFDRLASTLSRAKTYGADLTSCHEVRPFIMSARGVDEQTLPNFLLILVLIFFVLKLLLFYVVRLRAG